MLLGLVLIAPQVRVHQIEVYSTGSWLFRVGALLILVGLALGGDLPRQVAQVGQIMGVAGLMGGVITAGHEYRQARDHDQPHWDWPRSLTLQMLVLGALVLIVASALI